MKKQKLDYHDQSILANLTRQLEDIEQEMVDVSEMIKEERLFIASSKISEVINIINQLLLEAI